jgi:hypothetical protein
LKRNTNEHEIVKTDHEFAVTDNEIAKTENEIHDMSEVKKAINCEKIVLIMIAKTKPHEIIR